MDLESMLARSTRLQWSLDDFDWDRPGRDAVTREQALRLRDFMGDLVWIETLGATAFDRMSEKARDPTLRAVYAIFAGDERRHAKAEHRLMVRWGMLGKDEMPKANPSIRRSARFIEEHGHEIPLSVYAVLLPMLEIALDGALLQFLTDSVADPLVAEIFEKVNADEARHLAVDYYLLESMGMQSSLRNALELIGTVARPRVLVLMALGYIPMLERALLALDDLGLDLLSLKGCMLKFGRLGADNPVIRRHLSYLVARWHAQAFGRPEHPYHPVARMLVRIGDLWDGRLRFSPSHP